MRGKKWIIVAFLWSCVLLAQDIDRDTIKVRVTEKVVAGGVFEAKAVVPNASLVDRIDLHYVAFKEERNEANGLSFISEVFLRNNRSFYTRINIPERLAGKFLLYYITVKLKNGTEFRFPEGSEVEVKEIIADTEPPLIRLLSPEDDAVLAPGQIRISYSLEDKGTGINPKTIRFLLNGTDYTRAGSLRGNIYEVVLEKLASDGKYTHSLSVSDRVGNLGKSEDHVFELNSERLKENAQQGASSEWKGSGSLGYSYTSNAVLENRQEFKKIDLKKNGLHNVNFQYKAVKDDLEIEVGPVVWTSAPAYPGNRGNRFAFSLRSGRYYTQWGDISADLSGKTLSTSITGGMIQYRTKDNEKDPYNVTVKAAGGRSQLGYEPVSQGQVGAYSRVSYGGFSSFQITKKHSFYVAAQTTSDLKDSLKNKEGVERFENQSGETGFEGEIPYIKTTLKSTYAISLQKSEGNRQTQKQGYSMSTGLDHKFKKIGLSTGLTYEETSPNFALLTGGASADQRRINLQLGLPLFEGKISTSSSNSFSHNNLKGQLPETRLDYSTNNSVSLSQSGWPSVNYSNNFSISESSGTPDVKTKTQTVLNSLGLSYGYKCLSLDHNTSLNGSLTTIRDKSSPPRSSDSDSTGVTFTQQMNFTETSNVSYTLSRNESTVLKDQTGSVSYSHSLNYNFSMFGNTLAETISASKNINFTKDSAKNLSLQSTSYTYSLNSQYTGVESMTFSLNVSLSTQLTKEDSLRILPGNLNISFQFSKTL